MRRFVLHGCAVLLCAGCARSASLPPPEVLHRAVLAADSLESATVSVKAAWQESASTPPTRLSMDGRLRDGGRLAAATVQWEAGERSFEGEGVFEADRNLFVRVTKLGGEAPSEAPVRLGRWYAIALSQRDASQVVLPTDPAVLQAEAASVSVVRNLGHAQIHGRDAYHYEVTLDREKLRSLLRRVSGGTSGASDDELRPWDDATVEGELWIDSQTFLVHTIRWAIVRSGAQALSLEFSLDVRDHNAPVTIEVPAHADALAPAMFWQWMLAPSPSPPLP